MIGFDESSTSNLQNPFAKKPSLRGKNKSFAANNKKIEKQKSVEQQKESEQTPGPKQLTAEEKAQQEHEYEMRR